MKVQPGQCSVTSKLHLRLCFIIKINWKKNWSKDWFCKESQLQRTQSSKAENISDGCLKNYFHPKFKITFCDNLIGMASHSDWNFNEGKCVASDAVSAISPKFASKNFLALKINTPKGGSWQRRNRYTRATYLYMSSSNFLRDFILPLKSWFALPQTLEKLHSNLMTSSMRSKYRGTIDQAFSGTK